MKHVLKSRKLPQDERLSRYVKSKAHSKTHTHLILRDKERYLFIPSLINIISCLILVINRGIFCIHFYLVIIAAELIVMKFIFIIRRSVKLRR